jgi:hypothetical protein
MTDQQEALGHVTAAAAKHCGRPSRALTFSSYVLPGPRAKRGPAFSLPHAAVSLPTPTVAPSRSTPRQGARGRGSRRSALSRIGPTYQKKQGGFEPPCWVGQVSQTVNHIVSLCARFHRRARS